VEGDALAVYFSIVIVYRHYNASTAQVSLVSSKFQPGQFLYQSDTQSLGQLIIGLSEIRTSGYRIFRVLDSRL
jgi:hypothetical protein